MAAKVLFIGAGAVNFGGGKGPWDHSRRLERQDNVRIVAIADTDLPKAKAVLEKKLKGEFAAVYEECAVYKDYREAIEECKPNIAFIGELVGERACS